MSCTRSGKTAEQEITSPPESKLWELHEFTASDWVDYSFVIGGLTLDLLVVPLLFWRRTRLFAFAAAVVFNLINAVIFDIGIFPWLMLGALLIFFPPDLLRRFARAFMSQKEEFGDAGPSQASVRPETTAEGSSCPVLFA